MGSTSMGISVPASPRAHTLRKKSAMSLTRFPPTPMMMSPALRPTFSAGPPAATRTMKTRPRFCSV